MIAIPRRVPPRKPKARTPQFPFTKGKDFGDHQEFFVALLPSIHRHAKVHFRGLDAEARDDAVATAIAHAWDLFAKLVIAGRQELAFAGSLARYAVARTVDGRQVGTPANAHDVSSRRCQRRQDVRVGTLDQRDPATGEWQELLLEDRHSTPAEIACTRIDIQTWFRSLPGRHRKIARLLARGEQTRTVAEMFGLTPGRISQVRAELERSWRKFQGEPEATKARTTSV
jgi:hypothetical protein